MTLTVEDDFREFVVARWADLECVAHLVTLDAASARRVTTDALASLRRRWGDALDDGRPGWATRRAVLRAALATAPTGDPAHPVAPRADPAGLLDADDDPVLAALEEELRGASPLERALVAAGSVWAAGPDEVADLLGMPPADVRATVTAVRARLSAASDTARAADGLAPAPWALERDLDAVVERLSSDRLDPPDPAALVAQRRSRAVRRRALVLGGAAAVTVGAAGWWLRHEPGPTASAATPVRSVGLPPPGDPVWSSVARWPARGRLAGDPRVQALVIGRGGGGGGRLLWADDLDGLRLVVAAAVWPDTEDVVVRAWQGAAGSDVAALQEVPLLSAFVPGARGVLPLAVPTAPGALLLVLAAPGVTDAFHSPRVRAGRSGGISRTWSPVVLDQGVGTIRWEDEPGPALRVRCGDFDGPAAGPAARAVTAAGRDGLSGFAEETNRLVAAALGLPAERLRTEVLVEAKVGGGVIDPRAISPQGGDGRMQVLRTTTPDGAVIRSARVVDDGRSGVTAVDLEPPTLLPADLPADEPALWRLDDARPRVGRFLVAAPGAARVQLLSTSPNAYPVSKVTPTRDGVAVLEVVNADDAAAFRLVRRDGSGRLLGDAVPATGRELLDLGPEDGS